MELQRLGLRLRRLDPDESLGQARRLHRQVMGEAATHGVRGCVDQPLLVMVKGEDRRYLGEESAAAPVETGR